MDNYLNFPVCNFVFLNVENVQRIIAHFDLDSFFVSVEILNDPSLKGKPVIVGGGDRGVVAACSYEARKYGIHSAMPSVKARQLCPHAIVLNGHRSDYSKYSKWVTQIIAEKSPLFEKASIDEFYLDLTGMGKYFDPLQWTVKLRQLIIDETKLPISFGLAANKMLAKIATNQAKPNGYLQIPFGKEQAFLAPLAVDTIPGVGAHTTEVLKSMGIQTIQQITDAGKILLEEQLGKWGIDLWYKSQGIHHGVVTPYHEAKSVSSENTFEENTSDPSFLKKELVRLTEKICFQLRKEGKVSGCIALKIRYPDFTTNSRQKSIPFTNSDDELLPVLFDLFQKLYNKGQPVRLLGIKLSDLTNDAFQINLFNDTERKTDLYKAIDDVKTRFGKGSVKRASSG